MNVVFYQGKEQNCILRFLENVLQLYLNVFLIFCSLWLTDIGHFFISIKINSITMTYVITTETSMELKIIVDTLQRG